MRRLFLTLLFVVFLAVPGLVFGESAAAGQWNCVSDDGHGAVLQWTLLINENDGKLSGSIHNSEVTMPLLDPKFDGKTLTFGTFVNPHCTVKYTIVVDDQKMNGRFECPEASGTLKGTRQTLARESKKAE